MLLGDYPHVTIEDLIRAPFESTSAPGPELVKEENTRVLENGSALSGYLVDNDRENTITSLEPIASVLDQTPAAVDQKGTNCENIIEKASSGKRRVNDETRRRTPDIARLITISTTDDAKRRTHHIA
ncbi:hypothetical protein DPMN_038624 [Dreissena polymorpha]|uniref:Uncharacterized protein n=1 Tax=Dreissena polymorpha TaxID=45954 RepID=A0A9D4MFM7_DREPO|nr:hypothetical protein DPMN_038624 [Dreissena polymorpha]